MSYTNMSTEDRHALLRRAEISADAHQNGDVRPQIDEWKKTNPNAPSEQEYDYPTAARANALPDAANKENATLSPDYMKPDYATTGTFNADTGTYDYEPPTEESVVNSWLYKADQAYGFTGEHTQAMNPDQLRYKVARTAVRAGQIAMQGIADMFFNEPRILARKNERLLIEQTLEVLDRNKAMTDPEYFEQESARLMAKLDPTATAEAWDNRPAIKVIQPIDMKDEIVSEIGAFFMQYGAASKAMKVNPAKLGKYLNATVTGIKELIAGAFGDKGLAYGADLQTSIGTILRQAIESDEAGEEGGMATVGEWLSNIGIESEDLKGIDATEADSDLERANMFAIEGAILGVLFPAVLKGSFGTVKLGPKFWKYAQEGGFSGVRGPAAQRGMINLAGTEPDFQKRVMKYATADERNVLLAKDTPELERLLKHSATPQEVASMAAAGGAKRGWYRASVQALRHIFGNDSDTFTALLAATSPQTSVESNLRNTLNIWKNWDKAGRPTDRASIIRIMGQSVEGTKGEQSVLGAWRNNAVRALRGQAGKGLLSGPKVDSFMRNLMGFYDEVTQDTWMARGLGLLQQRDFGGRSLKSSGGLGVKGAGYVAGNMLVREATEIITKATGDAWTPAEVQETVWSWVKSIWDASNSEGELRNIPKLLSEGAITDKMIQDTPDFATMFSQQGEFKQLLEDAGYGKQIKILPTGQFGQGRAVSTGTEQGRNLESSAKRLDRTARRAGKGDLKTQNVEQLDQLFKEEFGGTGSSAEVLSQRYGRGTRRSGRHYLKGTPVRQYSLPVPLKKKFNKFGVSTPPLSEFSDPDKFVTAISAARDASPFGELVDVYPAAEYANMRTFTSSDGSTGFAIKPDGDIVSVFNTKGARHKNTLKHLIALAKEQGGTKLDCYDYNEFLPTSYSEMGFKETNRTPWDDAYAPDDWDYEKLNHPDHVEMELK